MKILRMPLWAPEIGPKWEIWASGGPSANAPTPSKIKTPGRLVPVDERVGTQDAYSVANFFRNDSRQVRNASCVPASELIRRYGRCLIRSGLVSDALMLSNLRLTSAAETPTTT